MVIQAAIRSALLRRSFRTCLAASLFDADASGGGSLGATKLATYVESCVKFRDMVANTSMLQS